MNYYMENNYKILEIVGTSKIVGISKSKLYYN